VRQSSKFGLAPVWTVIIKYIAPILIIIILIVNVVKMFVAPELLATSIPDWLFHVIYSMSPEDALAAAAAA